MAYSNRKGVTAYEVIIGFILAILAFAIIYLILTNIIAPMLGEYTIRKTCQISALATEWTSIHTFGIGSPVFSLKCKPVDTKITTKDKEAIKGILADDMYKCWEQMGQGKLKIYSDWGVGSDVQCVVCSIIKPKDEGYNTEINPSELIDYLQTKKPLYTKKTYLQLLTGTDDKYEYSNLGDQGKIIINIDNPSYTVFAIKKTSNAWETIKELGIIGGTFVTLKLVGRLVPIPAARVISFALPIPKTIKGKATAGAVIGVATALFYKPDREVNLLLVSGNEIAKRCDNLEG